MAILTGEEITNQAIAGNITIIPYNGNQVNPNSYNLRLHEELLVYEMKRAICHKNSLDAWQYEYEPLDMKKDNPTSKIVIPESGYTLQPGVLYLGRTVEKTHTDYYVPVLSGRSSVGRLGINIHVTAAFGETGFNGYWTLEIFVIHPVIIYPNVQICQVYFNTVEGEIDLYKGKYQDNNGVQASMFYKDFK